MSQEFAIHSDFLIHWTGKDLDHSHDPGWSTRPSSTTDDDSLIEKYIQRLEGILTHGLWLTKGHEEFGGCVTPEVARVCFSELRLSQARVHAKEYGRLGIGVKRPYVFERRGRPVVYVGSGMHSRERAHSDALFETCHETFGEGRRHLLNFFKPMDSSYKLYDECEWRILFTEALLREELVINPRDSANSSVEQYLNALSDAERENLSFLMPLDGWLSLVIYPSVAVKRRAAESDAIRNRIAAIKSDGGCRANTVEGTLPIELDLDACRNF